jgi:hypothetical protein
MFVRKSKIAHLIKKERQIERKLCEKRGLQEMQKMRKKLRKNTKKP